MNLKNTLAENMLRFGPKNLSESDRRNLQRLMEAETVPVPDWVRGIRLTATVKTASNPTIISKQTDVPNVQYIYFDQNSLYDGTNYAFEVGKLLVQTNFGNSGKIFAAGIPGTLTLNNGAYKFTAGTYLKLFTFSTTFLDVSGDGEDAYNDGLVASLLEYSASTKNGKVTAAQIGKALEGVGVKSLSTYWETTKTIVNMLANVNLCVTISDEDKNSINTIYKQSYAGISNSF